MAFAAAAAAGCTLSDAGTGQPECGRGETMCGDACVDTSADAAHCGRCGRACGDGQTCSEGACQGGGGADAGTCEGPAATRCLSDEALVARYFLDDAAFGTEPTTVRDAAMEPLSLSLTYETGLSFATKGEHRGLAWTMPGLNSRASVALDGTKLAERLQGSKTVTIELVLDVVAITQQRSRIVHIGQAENSGRLSLISGVAGSIELWWKDAYCTGAWAVQLAGRKVLHAVVDTDAADAGDRAQLYIDGTLQPQVAVTTSFCLDAKSALTAGDTIDLATGQHFVLGNREVGGRSFQGTMYYAALYASALRPDRITLHTQLLRQSDDQPAP